MLSMVAQSRQPVGGDPADGAPGPFELVDLGNQGERLGRDVERAEVEWRRHFAICFHPISLCWLSPFVHPFPSESACGNRLRRLAYQERGARGPDSRSAGY
jgi:hypothetical protein